MWGTSRSLFALFSSAVAGLFSCLDDTKLREACGIYAESSTGEVSSRTFHFSRRVFVDRGKLKVLRFSFA